MSFYVVGEDSELAPRKELGDANARIETLEAALRDVLAECDEAPTDNSAWVVAIQQIARTALTPAQDK